MARVYLLVNVLPGKETSIRDTMRGIKGIITADIVTGPFDIIAVAEGKDTDEIFSRVLMKTRKIKGLNRTETIIAVE
ncbi:MAG: Lrp/AsnC ligand binding domain-containing protein [Thermodesulfovibrionales bacterium]|jgi:DNA-binding Lrp family transcriptional regulator